MKPICAEKAAEAGNRKISSKISMLSSARKACLYVAENNALHQSSIISGVAITLRAFERNEMRADEAVFDAKRGEKRSRLHLAHGGAVHAWNGINYKEIFKEKYLLMLGINKEK